MRGSDPDAAIYWMMRMVEAGDDPLFVLRRMLIFASEDIGNADPRALIVAVAADEAFRRMGMPEGLYPDGARLPLLGVRSQVGRGEEGLARARVEVIEEHGCACRCPRSCATRSRKLMKREGYGAGLSVRARLRRACRARRETYLPDRHQRRFVLRADRRRAREGHQRAARSATQAHDLKLERRAHSGQAWPAPLRFRRRRDRRPWRAQRRSLP